MSKLDKLQTRRFGISLKGILNFSWVILSQILLFPLIFSLGNTHFRLRDTYWASLRSLFSPSFLLPIFLVIFLLFNLSFFRKWYKGIQVSEDGIESYEWSKTVVDPSIIKHIAALYSARGKLVEIAVGGSGVQKRAKDKLIIKYSGYQDMEGLLQAILEVSPPDVSLVSLPRSETRKFNYVTWAILFGIIFVVIVLWVFTSRNFVINTLIESGSFFYFYIFLGWSPLTFGLDPDDEKLHQVFWQKRPKQKSELATFVGYLFVPVLLLGVLLGPPIYREFVEGQTRICDRRFGCTHIVQLNGLRNGAMFLNDDVVLVHSNHEIAKYDLATRRLKLIFHGEDEGGMFHDPEPRIKDVVTENGVIVAYLESGELLIWGEYGDSFIASRSLSEFVEVESRWNVDLAVTEIGRFLLLSQNGEKDDLVVIDIVGNLNIVNRFTDTTSLKLYDNDKYLEYNDNTQQIEIKSILDTALLQIIPNVKGEDGVSLEGSPNGFWIEASFEVSGGQDYVRVWNAEGEEILELPQDLLDEDRANEFSPDGQYLVVGESGWVYIEDEWVNRRNNETHLYKFDPENGWQFHQRVVSQLGWQPMFSDDSTKLLYSSLSVFEVYDIKQ